MLVGRNLLSKVPWHFFNTSVVDYGFTLIDKVPIAF